MITRFEGMPEDDPVVRLRSHAGFGGARSRIPLPNQIEEDGEHMEGGDGTAEQGPSQQVVGERQRQTFIDRDKYVLVAIAVVAFNGLWLLYGGWVLANVLFVVASINFWRSIRSVAMIDIFFAFLIYTFESSLSNAL